MSDSRDDYGQRGKTQHLPEETGTPGPESRRTERLGPDGDAWSQAEPLNPGWRRERSGTKRAPRRGALPTSPQEFQLWMQAGGWRYLAGIAALLVVLLIALLAFARNDQREAGLGFESAAPTVGAPVLGGGSGAPGEILATVTPEPPPPPQRFVVAGTNGQGLFLRPEPSTAGDPLTTLPDGTVVEQIGADVSAPDRLWRQVRAPDGREGYVAADFLTVAP
jgi:hypothetical protein